MEPDLGRTAGSDGLVEHFRTWRAPGHPRSVTDAGQAGYARIDRMPPATERPAGPNFTVRVVEDDGRSVANANDYDSFAEAYTAETEANLINGYYMRPAILDLAGDVAGRRILDAGCGSGPISAALRD